MSNFTFTCFLKALLIIEIVLWSENDINQLFHSRPVKNYHHMAGILIMKCFRVFSPQKVTHGFPCPSFSNQDSFNRFGLEKFCPPTSLVRSQSYILHCDKKLAVIYTLKAKMFSFFMKEVWKTYFTISYNSLMMLFDSIKLTILDTCSMLFSDYKSTFWCGNTVPIFATFWLSRNDLNYFRNSYYFCQSLVKVT